MIETVIPVVIAIVTGTAVLFNKVNTRVTQLDNKVDKLDDVISYGTLKFTTVDNKSTKFEYKESPKLDAI